MNVVSTHALAEEILDSWRQAIGADLPGYRGHVYRTLNVCRALAPDVPEDRIAVASAFHDLGFALAHDSRHALRKRTESLVFRALAAYAAPRLAAAGIGAPAQVFGLHATGHVDEDYLLALIPRLGPGVSELYCHPAAGDPVAGQAGYDHAGELAALTSPRVRAALSSARVRLASWRELTT